MPDYNLGRAEGQIVIGADTRGATEAQTAMAATAAEAKVLDASMGRVNDQFRANQKESVSTAEQIRRHREQVEALRTTYQRYDEDYQRATARRIQTERVLAQARSDETTSQAALIRLAKDAANARDAEERLLGRLTDAHSKYQSKLASVSSEVERFNQAHIRATSAFSNMRFEAERTGAALETLSGKLSSVLRIVGQGGIMGLFGLSSAGTTAAGGAAGLSGITNVMAGAIETVQQLSGVLALLPAVVQGAAVSLGTLAVGFHGISESIQSMDDPQKFIESLKQLSPVAREAMEILYSFSDAFRGVRQVIQNSLFAPIIADLQPLIYTWLPQLMQAGQLVGNQFGQMAHQIFGFFENPASQQAFQGFIGNMVRGLEAARGAINPLLNAWQTLSTVGSGFFERIGGAVTKVAEEFNNWIERSAANGKLAAWIDQALTGFANLGHIVLNTVEAIGNIFSIGDKYGGGFLAYLKGLTEEFKNWTESASGMQKIANFFDLIHQAGVAMHPILKLVGEGFATVVGALTRLGIEIAPAVTTFFQDIVASLHLLAPIAQQIGPSISAFLTALGASLLEVVKSAGPELPKLFKGLSDALITLLPILPGVVKAIAAILDHLSPAAIQGIFLAAVAVKGLATAFGIFTAALELNPVFLAITAIALLAAGVAAAVTNFHGFGDTVSNALKPVEELADKTYDWGKKLITNFARGIGDFLQPLDNVVGEAASAVKELLQPGSPTKRGPLSEMSTEDMGARLSSGYARGIASGTGAVDSAASGIAGSASGITGTGFSTAGESAKSGSGIQSSGTSGFDQYIKFLTTDLTAWNNIFRESFNLVNLAATQIMTGIRVVASIWGGGNNPLTQPGGIVGPPRAPGEIQRIPGVDNVPSPGKSPIPALAPLGGGPPPGQQQIPGVPNVGPTGGWGSQGADPIPLPNTPGAAGVTRPPGFTGPLIGEGQSAKPRGPGTSHTDLSGYQAPVGSRDADEAARAIIAEGQRRQLSPEQIQAAIAVANQESGLGTNPAAYRAQNQNGTIVTGPFQQDSGYNKYGDRNNINDAAKGFIDQFIARGGLTNPDPYAAAVKVQVPASPGNGGYDASTLRAGQSQRAQDIYNRLAGTTNVAPTDVSTPTPFQSQPYGLPGGTDTGGYGSAAAATTFPPWVLALGAQFGVKPSTYGGHQESDRGGEAGYAPNPQNQNRGIDWVGTPEQMEAFAKALVGYGGTEGRGGGLEQVIYQAGPGGARYGLGGAGNINNIPHEQGGYYPQDDGGRGGSYNEHGGTGSGAHVHTRFSSSVPVNLSGVPPANPPASTVGDVGAAPIGNSGDYYRQNYPDAFSPSGGGFHGLPNWLAGTIGGTGGAALAYGAYRGIDRGVLAYNQAAFDQYNNAAELDALRGLSPQDVGLLGKDPKFDFDAPTGGGYQGLNVNVGGTPPTGGDVLEHRFGSRLGLGELSKQPKVAPMSPEEFANLRDIAGGIEEFGPRSPGYNGWSGGPSTSTGGPSTDAAVIPRGPGFFGRALGVLGRAAPFATLGQGGVANVDGQGNPLPGQTNTTPRGVASELKGIPFTDPVTLPAQLLLGNLGQTGSGAGGAPFNPGPLAPQAAPSGLDRFAANVAQQRQQLGVDTKTGQPIAVNIAQTGGAPVVPPAPTTGPPRPGQPGFVGPVAIGPGQSRISQVGQGAGISPVQDANVGAAGVGQPQKLPFNAQSPLDAATSGLSAVGNIASDAFSVFTDVIQNISATADITKSLVRGPATSEDIIGIVKDFQTYIKTAADVAHLVSDAGGLAAGAGSGDPTGMAGAIGGGIQAIAGMVSAALSGVNDAISLGIDVYHEVGKYAGFLFGTFLGGPNTGPLGGNVKMLLNTRTNQLQTYSDDNPLNKNTFNVPLWQRTYAPQAPTPTTPAQVNYYAGPGDTPQQFMSNAMYLANTGSGPAMSVSARN